MRRALVAVLLLMLLAAASSASADVRRAGGFRYVTKAYELRPGGGHVSTFKAACPKGTHVLGGGHYNNRTFGYVVGSHSFPYDSRDRGKKPDDGWAARLEGRTLTAKVRLYAICAAVVPDYIVHRYDTSIQNEVVGDEVDCGISSLSVISGGSSGDEDAWEVKSRPVSDPLEGDYWSVEVRNTDGLVHRGKLIAVCANLPVTHTAQTAPIDPASQGVATASCPAEAPFVVGGGQSNTDPSAIATAASNPVHFAGPGLDGWQAWLDNYGGGTVTVGTRASCLPHL